MKVEYDKTLDSAYFYVKYPIEPGEACKTYICDRKQVLGNLHLDFDLSGRLLGIEVLEASRLLHAEVLRNAEQLG